MLRTSKWEETILKDEQRIAAYYDAKVAEFGHDPRACDHSSQKSLEVRYRVLCEVLDLRGKSVLEVGCGFGDLGAYIQERFQKVNYTGVDISSKMIAVGRKVYPELRLVRKNFLTMGGRRRYDVVLAQGVFYLLGSNAEKKMHLMVDKMFRLAKEAVAFCTISSWSPRKERGEFYADPGKLLRFCKSLTSRVVLRHDYHPGDFTIYLYKEKR